MPESPNENRGILCRVQVHCRSCTLHSYAYLVQHNVGMARLQVWELLRCSNKEGRIQCGDYNAQGVIEIGGEIFAAEFIYPELEMRQLISQMGITSLTCTKEKVVEFKRACPAHLSYTFIVKRFERFGLCSRGTFQKIQFTKLEEELFGLPIYKQEWFKQHGSRKKSSKPKSSSPRTIIRK